ncbi:hypothetical protein [Pantoea stewartii]|uniref:hypothetical protein n=1 Tax=Pantoea stewartii TaxID=66269 RepID=UPI000A9E0E46|nr:hypothetical protein [Pantoea stewartii]MCU7366682.1 hypothetical protein [Pantoea stewartii]
MSHWPGEKSWSDSFNAAKKILPIWAVLNNAVITFARIGERILIVLPFHHWNKNGAG